jgi:hypothetical protein
VTNRLQAAVSRRQNFDWIGYAAVAAGVIEIAFPKIIDPIVPDKYKPVALLCMGLLVIFLRMYREHLNLNGVNIEIPKNPTDDGQDSGA